jgi:hypothetical protein
MSIGSTAAVAARVVNKFCQTWSNSQHCAARTETNFNIRLIQEVPQITPAVAAIDN